MATGLSVNSQDYIAAHDDGRPPAEIEPVDAPEGVMTAETAGEIVARGVEAGRFLIVTHPERLGWIGDYYEVFKRLVGRGAWMQLTAGSLTGRFGREPRYWSEKMLDDGLAHLLATDAHGLGRRAPRLAEGRRAAEKRVGAEEARRLVIDRPQAVLDDRPPAEVAPVPALAAGDGGAGTVRRPGILGRFMGRARRP